MQTILLKHQVEHEDWLKGLEAASFEAYKSFCMKQRNFERIIDFSLNNDEHMKHLEVEAKSPSQPSLGHLFSQGGRGTHFPKGSGKPFPSKNVVGNGSGEDGGKRHFPWEIPFPKTLGREMPGNTTYSGQFPVGNAVSQFPGVSLRTVSQGLGVGNVSPPSLGKVSARRRLGKVLFEVWHENAKQWLDGRFTTAKTKREKDIREPLEEGYQSSGGRWEVEAYKQMLSKLEGMRAVAPAVPNPMAVG